MRNLINIGLILTVTATFGQSLKFKQNLKRVFLEKGMYIDVKLNSTDQFNKKWTSAKDLEQDDLKDKLWEVDSINKNFIKVSRPIEWRLDTLSNQNYKKKDVKKLISNETCKVRTYSEGDFELTILKTPTNYESKTLNFDSIQALRFCEFQLYPNLNKMIMPVLAGSALAKTTSTENALGQVRTKILIAATLVMDGIFVSKLNSKEKVKTYVMKEWNIKMTE